MQLVNHISEELEPNKCIVHGQIGTYVSFNTTYVKYITHFNESSFIKFIEHFSLQYNLCENDEIHYSYAHYLYYIHIKCVNVLVMKSQKGQI